MAYASRRRITMRKKSHTPEEIVSKLRQVDVVVSQGTPVADAIRSIGVTEVTYYRWRQEYGGLKSSQVKRMRELETENQRLPKAIADLTLDKLILQEAARGNFYSVVREVGTGCGTRERLVPCVELNALRCKPRASARLCGAHPVCADRLRAP